MFSYRFKTKLFTYTNKRNPFNKHTLNFFRLTQSINMGGRQYKRCDTACVVCLGIVCVPRRFTTTETQFHPGLSDHNIVLRFHEYSKPGRIHDISYNCSRISAILVDVAKHRHMRVYPSGIHKFCLAVHSLERVGIYCFCNFPLSLLKDAIPIRDIKRCCYTYFAFNC